MQSVIGVLGYQCLLHQQPEQQATAAALQTAPQPVAPLSAALEDADADVRAAAMSTLQQLLVQVQKGSVAAKKEPWLEQLQQQVGMAGSP